MKKSIEIILTGGTIDSYYDGIKDTISPSKVSVIPEYIKSLKLYSKVSFKEICMKDSRSLTKGDRLKIFNTINKSLAKYILVTHGTYTMPDTARFLVKQLVKNDKVIILTGSMIPLLGFSPSDAGFNLGFALGKFDSLSPGVYVAMNGQIFTPDEVVKLISQGRFSSILNK